MMANIMAYAAYLDAGCTACTSYTLRHRYSSITTLSAASYLLQTVNGLQAL
jgi:hypothetical protein